MPARSSLRRWGLFALAAFCLLLSASAQDVLLIKPKPCRIRIVVVVGDHEDKVRDAEVELTDSDGMPVDRKFTDSDGQAEFDHLTGYHRVLVRGSEIQSTEVEFDVAHAENFHVQRVRVKPKPAVGENKAPEGEGTVPSVRLNISNKARKEYEKAGKALQQKKWAEAETLFQSAVTIQPDYDLAWNGLGVAEMNLRRPDAAEMAFRKAIQFNPKFAAAQRNLARILLAEKKYEESAPLLRQSLAIEPTNTWAMTQAAYALLQLKSYEEATALARRVHQFPHAGFAEAHMIAGYALAALGRKDEAVAEFELYLKEEPTGANAGQARESIARLTAAR
jgi:Flp pilus assembly protein TadD